MTADSPDPLDLEIAAAKRAVADAERALEVASAVLAALERVAATRPKPQAKSVSPWSSSPQSTMGGGGKPEQRRGSRGKAPGTLSNQWRQIMAKMVSEGNSPSRPDKWAEAAAALDFNIDPKSARDWLRKTANSEYGYIDRIGDDYRVSDTAIGKYGLKATEPPPNAMDDGSE